jgi:hypothetical protein
MRKPDRKPGKKTKTKNKTCGPQPPSAVAFTEQRYQTLQTKDESTLAFFLVSITKKIYGPLPDLFLPGIL